MKRKLLILASLLLVLAVILPACHTELIGLRTRNNIPCAAIPIVTYQVPGFGLPVSNSGPHSLSHSNVGVGVTTAYGDIGAGFGPNFEMAYTIKGVPGCYADGSGTLSSPITPGGLWTITWSISGGVASASASAE
jgi:hypothetical protein